MGNVLLRIQGFVIKQFIGLNAWKIERADVAAGYSGPFDRASCAVAAEITGVHRASFICKFKGPCDRDSQ